MTRKGFARAGLLLAALVGVLSLLPASAFAASKPQITGVSGASLSFNTAGMNASVNPKGASTTAALEYREYPGGGFKTYASSAIGAGTTAVPLHYTIKGLKPQDQYEFRFSAVNSFGTVYSAGIFTASEMSYIGEKKAYEGATFATTGSWTLSYLGGEGELRCTENGYGSIGHAGGIGDSYHVNLTGCATYYNGTKTCNHAPINYTLDGTFSSTVVLHTNLCEGEEEAFSLAFNEPFTVSGPWALIYNVTQPLTVSANVAFWSKSSVTSSVEMSLTGAQIGTKFGVSYE
jgi:hypothetical protein